VFLITHPHLAPKLKKEYSNAYAPALGFHSLYWGELSSICTLARNAIRLLIPVDAINSTNTDRKGNLIYRDFPEFEYTGDTNIGTVTVKHKL
jgi:hypothetical protein